MSNSPQILSPTANPKELLHYKGLSSTWWNKEGEVKALHALNGLRVDMVINGLVESGVLEKDVAKSTKPLQGLLILDAGCGGGILTEALARHGCTIVGLDLCPELIQEAKRHAALDPSLKNLSYVYESIEEHAKINFEKYDAVVTSEVLDHVNEPELFLEGCANCLKPGGSIFVTTFYKNYISWFCAIIFAEYIWNLAPKGTHHYDQFVSPKDTQKILEGYKCQTRSVRGMFYNFLTNVWFWWPFEWVSYALHAVKERKTQM